MTAPWLAALGERPHRYFPQIGSTNDVAASWAMAGAPDGAVVLADEQTAGRGRYDRIWMAAPASSLLMSVILRPEIAPEYLPRVTLMGAVALAEVLGAWGLMPGIKWPNDVLLEGRKVSGILAEGVWATDRLEAVVLGIGVNVRRDALSASDAVAWNAITVEEALGQAPDRAALLGDLLAAVDRWRAELDSAALLTAWRRYSVTLGQQIVVRSDVSTYTGLAEDIDPQGALLLRLEDGRIHRVLAGDVTLQG
jgi:BirA family biotin operon repressor/biotin-[acetyl-CoA-carboxylase] ligase